MTQENVSALLEVNQIYKNNINLDKVDITKILEKIAPINEMIILNSQTKSKAGEHTIGLIRKDKGFLVYNSNESSGKPKYLESRAHLYSEILSAFYTDFKLKAPKELCASMIVVQIFPKKITTFSFYQSKSFSSLKNQQSTSFTFQPHHFVKKSIKI